MTVKITKPQINVREELNDLKKPTGIAGEAMLRADTPQEQFNLIGAGRKNLIINGGMTVAQRGTSFGNTVNQVYTLDRWKVARYAANNYYTTQEAGTGGDPFLNYIKVRRNTGDTSGNALSLTQRIEPINFKAYRGRTVTLSFLYRTGTTFSPQYLRAGILGSTSGGATLGYWAYNAAGVGVNDQQIEPSTTWKQHTISFYLGTNVENLAVAFGVEGPYPWVGTAGSDDSFQIANVQLEAGEIATPFEHRSYGEELALCQRYFYRTAPANTYSWVAWGGYSNTTTNAIVFLQFPKRMRAVPTLGHSGNFQVADGFSVHSCSNPTLADPTQENARIDWTSSGLTIGRVAAVRNANDASAYLEFKAEL